MRCNVAIIGGGLTGCASAYYLRRAGASVALLEECELNSGASGRNAGSLHFQIEHRHVAHAARLAKSLEHLVELSRVAIDQWRGLEQELGEDLELALHGGLMVAETSDEVALLERKAQIETRHGLDAQVLGGAEVRRIAPYLSERVRAASLCRDEGHCNPRLLTPAFARKSAALGAKLRTRTRVQSLERNEAGWRVEFSSSAGGESLQADAVLNAAGARAGEIAALANYHLPIFPVGLLMNVTEKVGPCMHHLIQHVGRRISMKQTHDGNIMIGGGWSVRMRHNSGSVPQFSVGTPAIETVRANLRIARELAPMIEDVHLIRTWSGIAGVTSDQLPIIGEVGRRSRFFVAGGGSGFTFGPTYARLISELISTGKTSVSLEPYSPARFDHINMFMG